MKKQVPTQNDLPGNSLLGNENFEELTERGSSTLWFSILAVLTLITIAGIAALYLFAH